MLDDRPTDAQGDRTLADEARLQRVASLARTRKIESAVLFLNNHVGLAGENLQREAHQESYSLLETTPASVVTPLLEALTSAAQFLKREFDRPDP